MLYKAEKHACRAFPLLAGDGLKAGAKRKYPVLSPLDVPAEFTQHPPYTCGALLPDNRGA